MYFDFKTIFNMLFNVYTTVGITFISLFLALRFVLKTKKPYDFFIVIMKVGVNNYHFTENDKLNFKHKLTDNEKEIELNIKSDRIYKVKQSIKNRIRHWLKGKKALFSIFFREGETDPIEYKAPDVSARILYIVRRSRAISKAFKDEFSVPFGFKKLIFILGIVIIGAIIYLMMTGGINI